jgi:hypothetical protein
MRIAPDWQYSGPVEERTTPEGEPDVPAGPAVEDLEEQLEIDIARIEEEEAIARRRLAAIEAGRRKGGAVGAAMAGAMLALSEIYEGPKKDEIVAVAETPDEPGDIDTDGIDVTVGDVDVWAPPPGDILDDGGTESS